MKWNCLNSVETCGCVSVAGWLNFTHCVSNYAVFAELTLTLNLSLDESALYWSGSSFRSVSTWRPVVNIFFGYHAGNRPTFMVTQVIVQSRFLSSHCERLCPTKEQRRCADPRPSLTESCWLNSRQKNDPELGGGAVITLWTLNPLKCVMECVHVFLLRPGDEFYCSAHI